ncbi:hypothetical protein HWV07_12365 [Natronomonas salina]|uniref:hypothetical protein n=1 Tax=Natronomonas salina TaxID=1710540 RepID=UPI0015B70DD2|nr:hypothetical protein [Natronomonas salina]QLD89778.1 hypothetical protein HWV07_12365 [Natronomonas salina]
MSGDAVEAEAETEAGGESPAPTDVEEEQKDEEDNGLLGPDPKWTPAVLTSIRSDPRKRAVALVVAAAVGLGLAWVHWLGLFAAGALVGLVSKTLPRAVLAGLVFGALVLVATVLASPVMGAAEFLSVTPPVYVAVAAAFLAPAWGSLLRGAV